MAIVISLIALWFFGRVKSENFPAILKNFPAQFLLFISLFLLCYSIWSGSNYLHCLSELNVHCDTASFSFYFFTPLVLFIIFLLWSISLRGYTRKDLRKEISIVNKISIVLGFIVSLIVLCLILLFILFNILFIMSYL